MKAGIGMLEFVAPPMRQRESRIAVADARQRLGQIRHSMSDVMDNLTLALDPAANRHHAGGKDYTALFLEERRPDDEIGDAALVFDCDEHDAFRRSRHLPHQHDAGRLKPAAIRGLHRLRAGDNTLATQIFAEE